jgi:Rrf2 family cysteine metabolism transcriptional repressor
MKISTRGRYGLRAMLELARCKRQSPLLMGAVAEREDISRKYLHALLTALKSAGLVSSVRGAGGGFMLTKEPAEIRLSEILRAVEGPLSLVDCVADKRVCGRSNRCVARGVWRELSGAIESMLDSITLEHLIAGQGRADSRYWGKNRGRVVRQKKAGSRRRKENGAREARGANAHSRRAQAASGGQGQKVGKR